jgi:ribonucleoside-diphosphate reductase alpha chain
VYREGSRSGVLVSSEVKQDGIADAPAPKRPASLPCEIHRVTVDSTKWTVLVGLLNGQPYELFGGPTENIEIPKKLSRGVITKRKVSSANKKGRMSCYDFVSEDEELDVKVKDIAVTFSPQDENYGTMTRMISTMLRHGVPPHIIAEQMSREPASDMFTFSKVMARVLKKYVKEGVKGTDRCSECGERLVFQEGCFVCYSCGGSKCG